MEYFTSAPFSHLLRLYSPMAAQKYRKEAALALGYPPIQGCGKLENSVSWSDAATARLPSERQPLWLFLSSLSQSQLDVKQCLFFSWHLSPKPPVFKETDEQKRSQTHSSSKVPTSAWATGKHKCPGEKPVLSLYPWWAITNLLLQTLLEAVILS